MSGLTRGSNEWLSLVARGLIAGHEFVTVSGDNPTISMISPPEDIWDLGGIYTFSADGTAPIDTISSSDAADTMDLTIKGLDINGDEVIQVVGLNGQGKASLTTPLWRHNITVNRSNQNVVGGVYLYEDTVLTDGVPDDATKIRGHINNGNNRSLQGVFTIPNGKMGEIHWIYPFLSKPINASIVVRFKTRFFGEVQLNSVPLGLNSNGSSFLPINAVPPLPFPSRADLIPEVVSSTANDVGVGVNFGIVLIDL